MNSLALIVLAVYSLANAGILFYFFVYKQAKIDKEYNEQLDRIRHRYSNSTGKER